MLLFLYGEDTWRKKKKLAQIKEKFIKEADPSRLNVLTLAASDLEEETLRGNILGSPFLAKKKMVILQNVFSGVRRKGVFEGLTAATLELKEYTVLVISEDQGKPKTWRYPEAKELWEYLEKNASKEEFIPMQGVRLEQEIVRLAEEQGAVCTKEAAALLAVLTENNLARIAIELQKLVAFCGERDIGAKDVTLLCSAEEGSDIFRLLDMVGTRQKSVVVALEAELSQAEPLALVSRIVGHVRALLAVSYKGEAGGRALRLHPFQLRKIQTQIRNWDSETLKGMLRQLLLLDYGVKSGMIADVRTPLAALLTKIIVT